MFNWIYVLPKTFLKFKKLDWRDTYIINDGNAYNGDNVDDKSDCGWQQ